MSRRAVMRREQKEREKVAKKAKKGDKLAILENVYIKGKDEGMAAASAIIFMALHELYGFSHTKNGKGKLDKLIDEIRKQSYNMDKEPTRFNTEYYIKILKESTNLDIL